MGALIRERTTIVTRFMWRSSVQTFAPRGGHVLVKRTALSWRTFLFARVWVVQVSLVRQRVESGRSCSLSMHAQDSVQDTLRRVGEAVPGGTSGMHAILEVCRRTGKEKMFLPGPAAGHTAVLLAPSGLNRYARTRQAIGTQ
jgi:hypothetical protein